MNDFDLPHGEKEKEFLDAYQQYADAIYRHCFFRVYNRDLAQDLTQETFIKTWKYISEGKEIKNFDDRTSAPKKNTEIWSIKII